MARLVDDAPPTRLLVLLALLSGMAAGCAPRSASDSLPEIRVRNLPPTKSDIIEAVIRSSDLPRTVHWSCWSPVEGGTTIGRYLADRLASLEPDAQNWIEVRTVPWRAPTGSYWKSTVTFHAALDKEWLSSYGIEFLIRQRDGAVVPGSFSCPGH